MVVRYVLKRGGNKQEFTKSKLLRRLDALKPIEPVIGNDTFDSRYIINKVKREMVDGISTKKLDELLCEKVNNKSTSKVVYGHMAARILVSSIHKETKDSFFEKMKMAYEYVNPNTGKHAPMISFDVLRMTETHRIEIEKAIDYTRDYNFKCNGLSVLLNAYLLRSEKPKFYIERPQDMLMRVALGISKDGDINNALEIYKRMSLKQYTHATPTLFNAGTNRPQLSSCFLLPISDDSIEGIYKTLCDIANISKLAGGVGFNCTNIRAEGSYIKGTNGKSNGIVPMLRVYNETARYVDQGGGKRKGSFAAYLEPWHADIEAFINLRNPSPPEELRCRDLFFAFWVPDLFMEYVRDDKEWSLFCPSEAVGLAETWGEEFNELYHKYENMPNIVRKKIPAQELLLQMAVAQIQSGAYYMLYKDACNAKSNQKNLGTIKSSNLCCEIVQFSSSTEISVCNLASISLVNLVKDMDKMPSIQRRMYEQRAKQEEEDGGAKNTPQRIYSSMRYYVDYDELFDVTKFITKQLNNLIDINYYASPMSKMSNLKHRPMGIGVQAFADLCMKLGIGYTSDVAKQINKDIHEVMYYAALEASCELAQEMGPYESYRGSPLSEGKFQFDLWKDFVYPTDPSPIKPPHPGCRNTLLDWEKLRANIKAHGVRNSLLIALMPTASTSNILGNTESFEPLTSNIYRRKLLSGEYTVVNEYLMNDLDRLGLWDDQMKNDVIRDYGSVQRLARVPDEIKEVYKTVYELPIKQLIDMSADRGVYVDQSQSFNCHMDNPNVAKIISMHMYTWKKGLKTGMYYLRSPSAVKEVQITLPRKDDGSGVKKESRPMNNLAIRNIMKSVMPESAAQVDEVYDQICRRDNPDCITCSS